MLSGPTRRKSLSGSFRSLSKRPAFAVPWMRSERWNLSLLTIQQPVFHGFDIRKLRNPVKVFRQITGEFAAQPDRMSA